ncbi:MAG: type III pantothenate kinase [Ignavibacteria bacterium]|nr:type III pantothenate kinase [Ignavibacteria bacterium]
MNLAIDIGNSFTHIAVFKDIKIVKTISFSSEDKIKFLSNIRSISKTYSVTKIGISSVKPNLNKYVRVFIKKYFKITPLIINNKTNLPIRIKVENSRTLGSDRICNAVFGYYQNKDKTNVLVIDLGTANKFDLLIKNGIYIGGIIAPGLNISAIALNLKTSKLPMVNIENLKSNAPLIGKNTYEAIQSGLINYMKAAIEGIVKNIKINYPGKLRIYLSGGSAKFIKNSNSFRYKYCENTVLYGINYILNYQKIKSAIL